MANIERSLVIIKTDAIQRQLMGEIIRRIEQKCLIFKKMVLRPLTTDEFETLYQAHNHKPFYPALRDYMTAGNVVLIMIEGNNAVEVLRTLIGTTDGSQASPGTMRGDYCINREQTLVHASDSLGEAQRELKVFFPEEPEL